MISTSKSPLESVFHSVIIVISPDIVNPIIGVIRGNISRFYKKVNREK